jgi:hypothetical protein
VVDNLIGQEVECLVVDVDEETDGYWLRRCRAASRRIDTARASPPSPPSAQVTYERAR